MKKKLPSLELILELALKNQLPDLIEGRLPQFPEIDKREVLRLCDVLQKAEYLEIYLAKDGDGFPLPAYGNYINITVQGRDYLERLKQNKVWRRALGWIIAFSVGVATPLIVDWVKLLMRVFAYKHGITP